MTEEPENEERRTEEAPPAAPPPIITQVHKREGRRWVVLLLYLLVALGVATGVVFGVRGIYHAVHKTENKPAPASNNVPQAPSVSNKTGGQPSAGANKAKKPSSAVSQNAGQITDTGPGNTIVIFVTTTLAAAGLHYIYQLRKSSN